MVLPEYSFEWWCSAMANVLVSRRAFPAKGRRCSRRWKSELLCIVAKPADIGGYTDSKHYRLLAPAGVFTGYNLMHFDAGQAGSPLLAFTSCRRFGGKFHIGPERLDIALDLDGIELGSGQVIELESLAVFEGRSLGEHCTALADALRRAHPPIHAAQPPEV
ncbi:MAG: hypothetical protein KIT83_10030 [Bryobacterales bacterium]|nr:hypothetical protein [Bryobacterales bacterium]